MKNYKRYLYLIAVMTVVFSLLLTGCSGGKEEPVEEVKALENIETEIEEVVPAEEPRVAMDVPDLAEYVQQRTVKINVALENGSGSGSGFFIDDEGTIVTSYHVIDAATDIQVQLADGGSYPVETIVDFDEGMDVAVLKADISGNGYLKVIEEDIRTGEDAYAVGSSLGLLDGTFSNGIISNSSRKVGHIPCIQTTAAISNGNSGGPLVNKYGEVVGINAFSYTAGENLNMAVKIDVLDSLAMDKNWSISKYREWYDKEVSRSFPYYDYETGDTYISKVHTYQYVTGAECVASAFDWDVLEGNYDYLVEGYDTAYGLYIFAYEIDKLDEYTEYLGTVGFDYDSHAEYTTGTSYFYYNPFTGMQMDIFVSIDESMLIIEPCSNKEFD